MGQKIPLVLLSSAAGLQFIAAQAFSANSIVAIGPGGSTCPPALATTTYVVPAVYSSYFETAGTIFNIWGSGNSLVVDHVPTTVITTTYITSTVIQTVTENAGLSSSMSNTVFTRPSSGSPFSQVPPPSSTSLPVLTYTSVNSNGQTNTIVTTQSTPTLGQGVPSGTLSSIPLASPVLLAYSYEFDAVDTVARVADGYAGGDTTDGATQNCGDAGRYYLTQGQLVGINGGYVGRNVSDVYALFAASSDYNQITTVFSFVDGILGWNSPDAGPATFYQCGNNVLSPLYAGFPNPPFSNCTAVRIGAVTAAACPIDLTEPNNSTTGVSSASTTSGMTSQSSVNSDTTPVSSSLGTNSMSTSTSGTQGLTTTPSSGTASSAASSSKTTGNQSSSSSSAAQTSSSSNIATGTMTSQTSSTGVATGSPSSSTSLTNTGSVSSNQATTNTGSVSASSTTTSTLASPSNYCPDSNGKVLNGYQIYCDMAVDGENIGSGFQVASFAACVARCSATTECVSVSWNGDSTFCYLHSTYPDHYMNQTGVDSAVLVNANAQSSSTLVTTSASSTATQSLPSTSPQGSSIPTTSASMSSSQSTNSQGPANPGTSQSSQSTAGASTASSSSSQLSTMSSTASSSSSTSSLCPGEGGQVVNGYKIFCGQGGTGVNVVNTGQQAATFSICIQRCNDTAGCVGVSYQTDVTNGACYLYSRFDETNPSQTNYDTAVLVSAYSSGSASSSSSSSATSSAVASSNQSGTGLSTSGTLASTSSATILTSSSVAGGSSSAAASTSTSVNSSAATSTAGATCNRDNGQVVDGFQIFCSQGGTGHNIANTGKLQPSFQACLDYCKATTSCVGASYEVDVSDGACYLYDSIDSTHPDTTYDTAVLNSYFNSTASSSSSTGVAAASTQSSSATQSNSGGSTGSSSQSSSSSISSTSTGPSATASGICPGEGGQDVNGYHIYCGQGGVGTNLATSSLEPTFQDCMQLCGNTSNCIGVSYQVNVADGACYLYSSFTGPNNDTMYDTAVLQSYLDSGTSGSSTSSSSAQQSPIVPVSTSSSSPVVTITTTSGVPIATNTGAPCPNPDGTQYQNFTVYCDKPVNGDSNSPLYPNGAANTTSFENCLNLCQQMNDAGYACSSVAYSISQQTCYPHDSGATVGSLSTDYQGAIYTGQTAPPPASSTTAANAPVFTDPPCQANYTGDPDFVIKCGRAINGTDINPGGMPFIYTFDGCIESCRNTTECVSVSYENGPGDGHCYLHSEDLYYNTDLGYNSAVRRNSSSPLVDQN